MLLPPANLVMALGKEPIIMDLNCSTAHRPGDLDSPELADFCQGFVDTLAHLADQEGADEAKQAKR
jgi:hypothetical protein